MNKNLYILFFCIIFAAILVACTYFRLGAKVCDPRGNCVGVELETSCDSCRKLLNIIDLHNTN